MLAYMNTSYLEQKQKEQSNAMDYNCKNYKASVRIGGYLVIFMVWTIFMFLFVLRHDNKWSCPDLSLQGLTVAVQLWNGKKYIIYMLLEILRENSVISVISDNKHNANLTGLFCGLSVILWIK